MRKVTVFIPTYNNLSGVHDILAELVKIKHQNFDVLVYINAGDYQNEDFKKYNFKIRIVRNRNNIGALGSIINMLTSEQFNIVLMLSDNDRYCMQRIFDEISQIDFDYYSFAKIHSKFSENLEIKSPSEFVKLIHPQNYGETVLMSGWLFVSRDVSDIADRLFSFASCHAPHLVLSYLLLDQKKVGYIYGSSSVLGVPADKELQWNIEHSYMKLITNFRILFGAEHQLTDTLMKACYPSGIFSAFKIGLRSKSLKTALLRCKVFNFYPWYFRLFILFGFLAKMCVFALPFDTRFKSYILEHSIEGKVSS